MEYRHTPALHSAMPAGCKLVVQGAAVRRGMLLLTPQCCAVLGGGVPRLEDARRRMVAHWTQPAGAAVRSGVQAMQQLWGWVLIGRPMRPAVPSTAAACLAVLKLQPFMLCSGAARPAAYDGPGNG